MKRPPHLHGDERALGEYVNGAVAALGVEGGQLRAQVHHVLVKAAGVDHHVDVVGATRNHAVCGKRARQQRDIERVRYEEWNDQEYKYKKPHSAKVKLPPHTRNMYRKVKRAAHRQ